MDTSDDEIEKILSEITITDVRSLDDITYYNRLALDSVYSGNLKYEINKTNKEKVELFIQNGYEYIELTENTPSGWLCYIDTNKFYNLKIHMRGLFIKFKSPETILLKYYKRFYTININNKLFFRKLSNKDILKIHLIDAIKKN